MTPLSKCSLTHVSKLLCWQIILIFAAVFAVIVYRLAIKAVFAVSVDLTSLQDVGIIGQFATPQMLTTITASCLSLVVIMILNKVFFKTTCAIEAIPNFVLVDFSCTSSWRFGWPIWVSFVMWKGCDFEKFRCQLQGAVIVWWILWASINSLPCARIPLPVLLQYVCECMNTIYVTSPINFRFENRMHQALPLPQRFYWIHIVYVSLCPQIILYLSWFQIESLSLSKTLLYQIFNTFWLYIYALGLSFEQNLPMSHGQHCNKQ